MRAKKCFVRFENDKYFMIYSEKDTLATDYDVSASFDYIMRSLSLQAVLMFLAQVYHLLAIYVCKPMLRYRFLISKLNKLNLLFGVLQVFYLHYYRFYQPGKICSGDYLSADDWLNSEITKHYLTYQGTLYLTYIKVCWGGFVASALMVVGIVMSIIDTFS